jgi:hypothetical protein
MGRLQRIQAGYDTPFIEELAVVLGPRSFFRWAQDVTKTIELLQKRFGEAEAQFLIGWAATWNGCQFCSVGHVYAGNLLWFRRHGRLFPLDERDVPALATHTDAEMLAEILRRLAPDPDTSAVQAALRRMFELKMGTPQPAGADDDILRATIASWDLINECSILVGIDAPVNEVPPLWPIAKDKQLRRLYAEARGRPGAGERGKWG